MRRARLKTLLIVFAVSTALAGLIGKSIWDIDLGPETNLRRLCRQWGLPLPETSSGHEFERLCRRWDLPVPETIEELDAVYGGNDPVANHVWLRVRMQIPSEDMADWMRHVGASTWATWQDSTAETREYASEYGCDAGTTNLYPHPAKTYFGYMRVFADPEAGKIDIVWIR